MKIGSRLGASFAGIICLIMLLSIFTVSRLALINSKVKIITDDQYPKTVLLNEVNENINIIARALRNSVILEDPAQSRQELDRIPLTSKDSLQCFEKLKQTATSLEEKKLLEEIDAIRGPYKTLQKQVIGHIEENQKQEAGQLLMGAYRDSQRQYISAIKKMIELESKGLQQERQDVEQAYKSTRNLSIVFSALAALMGAIFGYLATKSITRPVAELVEINGRLADGDLTVNPTLEGNDEMAALAASSRKVVHNMRGILAEVADASRSVAAASRQMQATAAQIAGGAEEMVSEFGTVAVATEEMAATSNDIASNCHLAAENSQRTISSAVTGSSVVQETIEGMARITDRVQQSAQTVEGLGMRSEQIGEIVSTIEDIADQTNLLALNAAIEAARAGEQGRGFAVVADEVRALAERTTKATREISTMIQGIQKETSTAVVAMEEGVTEVGKGAASSEKSGQALEQIQQQINELSMQINQIATAAAEQTATTGEISSNVQRANGVAIETARGASETAIAADQLAVQAEQLQAMVHKFRLA
ncbi:methyl-accepting chemotaxis protein [Geomesophilobacter sediminis]|uniref:Methyl-accepting chemotaxis protein n=1 Tax=Geomesophilobacter sediminis TaxID=2798584 RepID=A0A8J7LYV7_9BACT|nr:methyl-accepting chemotaxis protein [Geomesophilobacter sediminis]MBJ6725542.1 methyl-accepting chemotaxis protein [Geomesophilobacter sediminis]